MKHIMNSLLFCTIVLFLSTSCAKKTVRFTQISITLPKTVSLEQSDVSSMTCKKDSPGNNHIDILIYYYTSGIEVIKYTENHKITRKIKNGQLHAVVKFKINNKLESVEFIKISAPGKKALLKALHKKIQALTKRLYP